ncbi:DUF4013 domain-containing protein [Methanocella arvoryzae]|uniref:DUF4013 domain-containing protein n=1 Tax=Methanocella arvoryzae (strain DSM 22066 / NBRC 105507 / MRE50) TaxID=351160 RepID=Q0W5T8_METAR|nr:DUF4013 domain-containing protein [Methanocella arvoryzae]CAJ36255.1 hypothetical protein RCIX908 [Methanocella arvoryzae MRE50]
MPPNNDLLETILMAGKYALSNLATLLVGGIVVALSFLVIGLPFFLGFVTRCMREIVRGNGVLPEWVEIGQMFVDGIRMTLVFLAYAAVYALIVLIPGIPVLVFSYTDMTFLLLISTILLVTTMAITAATLAFVFFASWVLYASTGSVRKAINIKKVIGFILYNPEGFLVAIASSAAIAAIGVVAMTLVVSIPWAVFTISVAITFIYARFYQDTAKLQPRMVEWLR